MGRVIRILIAVVILATAAFLLWPKIPTMPVYVDENHIGVLKDPVTKDCAPHRGYLSNDGKYCLLHGKTLTSGWHEVDLTRYEVELFPTEQITIEIR